ncbi:MAG TPA: hypothetical protein VJA46_14050 [Acidimicrobiia bacterium]|nr:hypothetical protein [Acidimicrobiia bacterium]
MKSKPRGASVDTADLCLSLMRADHEDEVVELLTEAGYWEDPTVWRHLGDMENNFSSVGNQQSEPIAALVEKIVNGVDARLMNACHEAGIDPEAVTAPGSIREAVSRFFEGHTQVQSDRHGRIAEWTERQGTAEGRFLTLSATGEMPEMGRPGLSRPSLSIADQGEGQTPGSFPTTFMSLSRSNKLRIHFVQGKFNMGGTGALNFCSERHRFQLIVSKRNPRLLPGDASQRDREWGLTIVRRQAGEGGARSSVFTYLAPVGATGDVAGEVLSFDRARWPIFPEDPKLKDQGADEYSRDAPHGTLVKLYEYDWQGGKSNIVRSGEGLLRRIDLALPELALPVRLFECRRYRGGPASFSTNALGLVARLDKDKADNLEPEFPVGANIALDGKHIAVRVYAFKAGKAKEYRQSRYGVVFSVNGQMHAAFPTDFFGRKAVNLGYIADSLLVVIDCSNIDELMREDLFMNSRDRLRDKPLARRLEEELQRYLREESALRALQNKRRAERTADRLKDDKPLADVLQSLLKSNPLLSRLFQHGLRLSAPFPPAVGSGHGQAATFKGRKYPTFFRFKGRESAEELTRDANLGSRLRIAFETDALDDYFIRENSPGAWRVRVGLEEDWLDVPDWTSTGPRSGIAQLWLNTLPMGATVGDVYEYLVEVTDDSRVDSIENRLFVTVARQAANGGGEGSRSAGGNKGKGNLGGASQFALPPITPVHEVDWEQHGMDEGTALKVELADSVEGNGDGSEVYDFFVNVDNRYLRVAQKEARVDAGLLEKQFLYGMVLVGLALLQEQQERAKRRSSEFDRAEADRNENPNEFIAIATRALAPIFLPMLESIGGLALEEID